MDEPVEHRPDLPEKLLGVYKNLRRAVTPVGFDPMALPDGIAPAPELNDAPRDYLALTATSSRNLIKEQTVGGVEFISVQPLYSFVVDQHMKPLITSDLVLQFSVEKGVSLKDLGISVYKFESPLFLSNLSTVLPDRLLGFEDPVIFKEFVGWIRMAVFADMGRVPARQFAIQTGTRTIVDPLDGVTASRVKLAIPYGEGGWVPSIYMDDQRQLHIDYQA